MDEEIKKLEAALAVCTSEIERHALLDQLIILYTLRAIERDPHGGRTFLD
jgi:hypothetical protein